MTRDLTDADAAELDKLLGDRLLRVRSPRAQRRYDPRNIFRVHHGVGSEAPG